MIKKIWRYCHLYLAVSSSLFLLLATLTGIILAFEPIQTQAQHAPNHNISDISLAEIIPQLKTEYDEVFELKRSEDDLISVSALSVEKDIDGEFLIDVSTGKTIEKVPEQSAFFKFITKLHRSLFLKNTGRWLVGINSLFLFLIAITGLILIIKRQHGIQHFFKKIIRLDFPSYSHAFLGRLMLIPLTILALSAVILFLIRFDYLPNSETTSQTFDINTTLQSKDIQLFEVFNEYNLSDIKSVEFPFSEDEEDYFILNLKDRKLHVHQYNGQLLEEIPVDNNQRLYDLNLFLHTGKGSILWAIVLGLSGISILYFMYSGMLMALPLFKRKTKNKIKPNEAEIVVLYGSETGSTQHFAELFFQSLINEKKKAYITHLNNYQSFAKMKKLVVMTSTHGKGEPPHNAFYFDKKWKKFENSQEVEYAVVGFGSTHYPDFCAFAKEVNHQLYSKENFNESLDLKLIDNRSTAELKSWWNDWNIANKILTQIPEKLTEKHKLHSFKIISKNTVDDGFGTTFLLKIKSQKKLKFASGDLLGVFPPQEEVERFYSIGKSSKNEILLSVKLHDKGLCSNFLNTLKVSESFDAYIKSNSEFLLPSQATSITFISNGTGIAPYLGMVNEFSGKKYFYWGGRKKESWNLYEAYIQSKDFEVFEIVYSRENKAHKYIQDLIAERKKELFHQLQNGGVLLFCGSMQMQEDVMDILDAFAQENNLPTMEFWIEKRQILIDTY